MPTEFDRQCNEARQDLLSAAEAVQVAVVTLNKAVQSKDACCGNHVERVANIGFATGRIVPQLNDMAAALNQMLNYEGPGEEDDEDSSKPQEAAEPRHVKVY